MAFQTKDSISVNGTQVINSSGNVVKSIAVSDTASSSITRTSTGTALSITAANLPAFGGTATWQFVGNGNLGGPGSWIQFPDSSVQTTAWTGTADASTLTGTSLNSTVVSSSLTSVGTLTSLTVQSGSGVNYISRFKGSTGGDQFAIGVSSTAGYGAANDVLNSAGTAYAPYTVSSSTITLKTGTSTPATALSIDSSGNVTFTNTITGSVTGNAGTATKLATARAINGVNFDGSAAITVTAAAGTLTGTTLNSTVVNSSLTSVGTLTSLTSSGAVSITDTTASQSTTTGALKVSGGVGVAGNIYLGGGINATGSIYSAGVNVTYAPVNPTGQAFQATGKDTQGGTGYFDFFKTTNTTSGVTNGSKTFRLNSVGTLEILNSAYNATILSVTDAGFISINASSSATDGVPTNNGIAMNANSYIFDDGNYHITTRSGNIWLNSNNGGTVQINTQMPAGVTGGGLVVQGPVTSRASGGSTAFISSGANVISGVALQLDSGTAGTAANMAVRDTSTVSSTMYFDVSTGGSGHGTFQFRSSNAFTQLMSLSNSQVAINKQTLFGGGSFGAYVTITGTNSYNLGGPYGYLAGGGAGSVGGGGNSGTVGWSLQCAGRIQVNEIDATSDERLKDIQGTIPLDRALQFVRAVDGILYTWKPGFGDEGLKSGFGAQSVHKAGFDHMVAPIPNDRVEGSTDADGFTSPDKFQLTLNYLEAIPYHHEVIKHLLDRIEQLEATVAKLAK